jgi:hypothetical protein
MNETIKSPYLIWKGITSFDNHIIQNANIINFKNIN